MKAEVAVVCFLIMFGIIQGAAVPEECECDSPGVLQSTVNTAKNTIKYFNNLKNDYKNKLLNKIDDYQKKIEDPKEIPYSQAFDGHNIDSEEEYRPTFNDNFIYSDGFENYYKTDDDPDDKYTVQFNGGSYSYSKNADEDSDEEQDVPKEQFMGQGDSEEGHYNGLGNEDDRPYGKPYNELDSYTGKEDNKPGNFGDNYYEEYHMQYETQAPSTVVPPAVVSTQAPPPVPSNVQTTIYTSSKGEPGKNPMTQTTVVTGTSKLKPNFPAFPAYPQAYPSFPSSVPFGYPPLPPPPFLPPSFPTRVPSGIQNFGQFSTPQPFGPALGAYQRIPKFAVPGGYVRY